MITTIIAPINGICEILQEKYERDNKIIILRPYVLQEHISDRAGRHYDFRIMYLRSNKLASWALPKAKIPKRPREKYLAVRTKDHDAIWLNFRGKIPEGEYGSGRVKIVQKGELEIIRWSPGYISFNVQGKTMNGKFGLIRMHRPTHKQEEWLITRLKEED